MRVQFEFSKEAVDELDSLKSRLNARYRGDVINHALGVLKWLVKERSEGNKIILDRNGSSVEVVFPEVESLLSEKSSA